jgi:dsDNA-specific endonuclease/ATPase MutS2
MDEKPLRLPIDGILDLHTFRPKDACDVTDEYIRECLKKGISRVRIIHGKGTGTLRETIQKHLMKNPSVARFSLAMPEEGGWGATVVTLRKRGR